MLWKASKLTKKRSLKIYFYVLGDIGRPKSLKSLDSLEVSLAQFDGDEVLVEDWVLDTYSEDVELPLAVEPLAFSLTLGHERTRNCGCG